MCDGISFVFDSLKQVDPQLIILAYFKAAEKAVKPLTSPLVSEGFPDIWSHLAPHCLVRSLYSLSNTHKSPYKGKSSKKQGKKSKHKEGNNFIWGSIRVESMMDVKSLCENLNIDLQGSGIIVSYKRFQVEESNTPPGVVGCPLSLDATTLSDEVEFHLKECELELIKHGRVSVDHYDVQIPKMMHYFKSFREGSMSKEVYTKIWSNKRAHETCRYGRQQ